MALISRADLTYRMRKGMTKTAADILAEQAVVTPLDTTFDVFLSHSYSDAQTIEALASYLRTFGHSVYVDWIVDRGVSRAAVTVANAELLRHRMNACSALLYALPSTGRVESARMPWELGYFDGRKGRVAVLPYTEPQATQKTYEGQEYLGLYPYIARDTNKRGEVRLWAETDPATYSELGEWLRSCAA